MKSRTKNRNRPCSLLVRRILEFDQAKRKSVDEQRDVGSALVLSLDDGELVDRQPIVVRGVPVVEHGDLRAAARHPPAVQYSTVTPSGSGRWTARLRASSVEHGARLETVLSDNGRAYCGREDQQPYELFLQVGDRAPQDPRTTWYESVSDMQAESTPKEVNTAA